MNGPAVIVLVIILIICLNVFGDQAPARYADQRDAELRDLKSRLSDVQLFAGHDHAAILYVIRAERDLELCSQVLSAFRRGHVDRKHVEQLFRQLRRDMAEFPPVGVQ